MGIFAGFEEKDYEFIIAGDTLDIAFKGLPQKYRCKVFWMAFVYRSAVLYFYSRIDINTYIYQLSKKPVTSVPRNHSLQLPTNENDCKLRKFVANCNEWLLTVTCDDHSRQFFFKVVICLFRDLGKKVPLSFCI